MYKIEKEFHFFASHQLNGLSESHPCFQLHDHLYRVVIALEWQTLNDQGFVVDYNDLTPLQNYIDSTLAHKNLNDVFDFQTSPENIAKHLYDWCSIRWKCVCEVRVSQTPETWASYNNGAR